MNHLWNGGNAIDLFFSSPPPIFHSLLRLLQFSFPISIRASSYEEGRRSAMSDTQKKGWLGFPFTPRGSRETNSRDFSVFGRSSGKMTAGEREGSRLSGFLIAGAHRSGGEGKEYGDFSNGEILEDAALERREKEALSQRVEELEKELYDYQYHMGLLLIEKKIRNSEFEELRQELAETKETLKRERVELLNTISDKEKQEQNTLMALEVERQHVANLRKTIWKMQTFDKYFAQHANLQTLEPTLQEHEKELEDYWNKPELLNKSCKLREVDISIKTQASPSKEKEAESLRKLDGNERGLHVSEAKLASGKTAHQSEISNYKSKKQAEFDSKELRTMKGGPASLNSVEKMKYLKEQCNSSLQALMTWDDDCTKDNEKIKDDKEEQRIIAKRIATSRTQTGIATAPVDVEECHDQMWQPSIEEEPGTSIIEDFLTDNQQLSELVNPGERALKILVGNEETNCQHGQLMSKDLFDSEITELDNRDRDFRMNGSFKKSEKSSEQFSGLTNNLINIVSEPDVLTINQQSECSSLSSKRKRDDSKDFLDAIDESKLVDDQLQGNADKNYLFSHALDKVVSEMDVEDSITESASGGLLKRQRTCGPGISSPGEKRYNFRASTILKVTRSRLQKSEQSIEEGGSDGADTDYEPTGSD